jgi:hypothetical protein
MFTCRFYYIGYFMANRAKFYRLTERKEHLFLETINGTMYIMYSPMARALFSANELVYIISNTLN